MNEPILATPYEQSDFSGGFTDNYFNNDPRKCVKNVNFLIDNNRKLLQRPGSSVYLPDASILPNSLLPSDPRRVGRFIKTSDERTLLVATNSLLYYLQQGAGNAWSIPNGFLPNYFSYPESDEYSSYSWAESQKQLLITNGEGAIPIKVYRDQDDAVQLRTAGLPEISTEDNFVTATATASLITLANALRAKMLVHYNNTNPPYSGGAPHITADTVSAAIIGADSTTLATLIVLVNQMKSAFISHQNDLKQTQLYHYALSDSAIRAYLGVSASTPVSGYPFSTLGDMELVSTEDATDIYTAAALLNDLKRAYNTHTYSVIPHNAVTGAGWTTVAAVYGVTKGPTASLSWAPYYAWATQFKTKYNAHLASGGTVDTAHSTLADAVNTLSYATPATGEDLINALVNTLVRYQLHDADARLAAAWVYHVAQGISDNRTVVDGSIARDQNWGVAEGNFTKIVTWIADLATKYNRHSSDLASHYTNNPSPFINPFTVTGYNWILANYNYAIHFAYTYTVGELTFEDAGPVYYFAADEQLAVENYPITVANIPILVNTGTTQYDVSNITVKIFRTTNGGTSYYQVGEVANGTTTFTDNVSDEELVDRTPIYTAGGVVSNEQPKPCRCVHIVNNTGYYGYITDTDQVLKNRILQSVPGDFDSVPGDFSVDLDDEVVAISSVRTTPVGLGLTGIYRLEGVFDLLGNGAITPVSIYNPDGIGCVSENSVVRIDNGILFAGTDGFYFTDGYQLMKLSGDWNATYQLLVKTDLQKPRITGSYDKLAKRVHWAAQLDPTATDNDTIFCLDLNHNFPSSPCWSTWSNGSHFAPTALIQWQGKLLRGDSRGYILAHDDDLMEDAYINPNVTVGSWGTKTVQIQYKSCASDLGMGPIRKHSSWVSFNLKNEGNLHMQPTSINDDGRKIQDLAAVASVTSLVWGDTYLGDWGTPGYLWNYQGSLSLKRRMAAGGLRFTYKQIELTSILIDLKTSATYPGNATVNPLLQTVTLDDTSQVFPPDLEGHFIRFPDDDEDSTFEITSRTSDSVITVDASSSTGRALPTGSQAWVISGYPKYEKLHLLSYAVHAVPLSSSQYAAKTTGIGEST